MKPKSIHRTPFEAPTHDHWRAQVERDLKGASFEKRLVHNTDDNIPLQPLYTEKDTPNTPDYSGFPGQERRIRGERVTGNRAGWQITSVIREPSPSDAAKLAAREIDNGAHGLLFETTSPWEDQQFWPLLFPQLSSGKLHLSLPSSARKENTLQAITEALNSSSSNAIDVQIYAGLDPIGALATSGRLTSQSWDELASLLTTNVNSKNRYLRIDDLPYHHAGASEGQSIGFSLAAAVDSLRRLEEKGVNPTTSAASLEFMQHLDCEFFQGIAKLRATRMVWDQVRKTCSLGGEIRLHSRTSPRVLSQRDPWVNILRNTTSCFAGAIGGADAISTDSFDCRLGLPNQGGQRLARNTQLILGKESHLHQVIDPAGGAHFIESLTLELAKRAWAEFQAVEARGGMEQSLQEGWIHDEIEATKNSRQQAINKRKRAITGVSEFPHIREKISPQRPSPASTDLTQTGRTLRPVHFADAFEELRDRSDKWLLDHGERPKVGLLNLGPVSNHTGRSTFIQNLVEAGGFDTLTSGPITTSEEAIDAAKEMIGKPVILCCSNEDAKHLARPIAIALQKLNLPLLWLAGKPEEDMSSYTEAGIQQVVKLGDDMVLRLGQLWTNLEGK